MLVNQTQKGGTRTCFLLLYPEHGKLPETTEMAFLERQREPTTCRQICLCWGML